ncbi:GIY-YIG nuclease family protein [Aquibacillus sediminis]|uniref:GIY-YIG nuclease family protein n=1 Tax=Aquibacillus sediminis TaxID=2574734 RepID=UPI0011098574|nr:GIY-YIG nuclease family protein [Aquibacillus sediminis]
MKPFITYQSNATLYAIKANMPEDQTITIGKLGSFTFLTGTYVYVGSAKRYLQKRVERHLKIDKKLHWHYDYLRSYLEIKEVQTYAGNEEECRLFQRLYQQNNASMPCSGFGSSDCTCKSHLFFCPIDHTVIL